jgi:hypothetical protein
VALTATSAKSENQPKLKPFGGSFSNPYSFSKNYDFFKTPTIPIGIGIGTIFNKRHKIELEWEKSAVSYKAEIFVRDIRYEEKWEIVNPAINERINRFFINYSYRLTKNPNKTSVWLNVSSGISISSMFNLSMGRKYSNFLLAPNVFLDYVNLQSIAQTKMNANIKLGFDVDLYRKEKYILSLSLAYTQGFGKLQQNALHIGYTKYDENNYDNMKEKDFSREIYSRGSAFQLSVSRRFQLYPWILLSKKKREAKML